MTDPARWTLLDIVAVLRRYRRWLVLLPVLAGALTAAVVLKIPRKWSVTLVLQPAAGGSSLGSLAGIASQFGVRLPGGGGDGPAFYMEALRSRALLTPVAQAAYAVAVDGAVRTQPLADWLRVKPYADPVRLEVTLQRLRSRMTLSESLESGLLRIRIRTRWPDLSAALADSVLEAVRSFDVERRRRRVAAEVEYIEAIMAANRRELQVAEQEFGGFLARNRDYERDPALRFQGERLSREVDVLRGVDRSLRQELEQKRIEGSRTLADLTVVQPPYHPAEPERRRLVRRSGIAVAVAWLLLAVFALVREALRDRMRAADA